MKFSLNPSQPSLFHPNAMIYLTTKKTLTVTDLQISFNWSDLYPNLQSKIAKKKISTFKLSLLNIPICIHISLEINLTAPSLWLVTLLNKLESKWSLLKNALKCSGMHQLPKVSIDYLRLKWKACMRCSVGMRMLYTSLYQRRVHRNLWWQHSKNSNKMKLLGKLSKAFRKVSQKLRTSTLTLLSSAQQK